MARQRQMHFVRWQCAYAVGPVEPRVEPEHIDHGVGEEVDEGVRAVGEVAIVLSRKVR